MFKNFYKNKYNRGVTLIELLVVISIFALISTITVFSYGKFNSSLSIQNLADDIALSVRRAQGYAIGVRGYNNIFNSGYGIRFTSNPNISNLYIGSNKSFVLFTDISNDGIYDNSSSVCGSPVVGDECLELLSITTLDKISEIYLNEDTSPLPATDTIDLVFNRPNPEPTFCHRSGGGCLSDSISSIRIKISTEANPSIYKIITIANNGQISVSN